MWRVLDRGDEFERLLQYERAREHSPWLSLFAAYRSGVESSSMVAYEHVAQRVPDLRAAEGHYRAIFGTDLVGRESLLEDGRCLYCIGVTISPQEVREIHARLPDSVAVEVASEDSLTFVDRYGATPGEVQWPMELPGVFRHRLL